MAEKNKQDKQKEEGIVVEGVVVENLKNGFRVKMCPINTENQPPAENAAEVLAHLAGKMRMHNIKVVPGDRVKVELSPYDLSRGRIIFRTKG